MILTGFFRCLCGKLHSRGGMRADSLCVCGRNVYDQGIGRQASAPKVVGKRIRG